MEAEDEIFVKIFVRNVSNTMLEIYEIQCGGRGRNICIKIFIKNGTLAILIRFIFFIWIHIYKGM